MSRAAVLAAMLALAPALPAALASSASAGVSPEQVVAHAAPRTGPVISGHLVEWVAGGGSGPLVVRAASPGGRPRTALRIPRPGAHLRRSATALVAAGDRVELAYRTLRAGATGCVPYTTTLAIALPSAAVARLERETHCDASAPDVYRVSVQRPGGRARTLTGGVERLDHLTAAGRYLAWQQAGVSGEGDPIVIYDLVARRALETIVDPSLTLAHDALAIDARGRLAATVYDPSASTVGARYDLEWWALGHTTPHDLAGLFAASSAIRFQAGHIAFEELTGFGASELTLTDLAGRTVEIARFVHHGNLLRGFDYDGHTVAWAQRGPGRPALILRTSVPAGTG